MKKKQWLIWIGIVLGIIIFMMCSPNLFGSYTDWINQHSVFPEYFRNLFYETGDLFPNFAFQIGGGQNIYHFAYYGLFSPLVLLSYLFPFIKMVDYIMFMNLLTFFISGYLFYLFLKSHHFSKTTCVITTILFVTASPFLFHLHRHFMFVNYMPFLLMGLIGVDQYFQKKKSRLLILAVFLMILTSFYYSIGGIGAIIIYGIYQYIKRTDKLTLKTFFLDGIYFLTPILIGILLSSFLIVPTFAALFGNRMGGSSTNLLSLFIPDLNLDRLLYDGYTLGVTSLTVIAVYFFGKKKKKETTVFLLFLLVILFLPFVTYLLNGTLYLRSKVLIPFLPLLLYLIAHLFETVWKKEFSIKNLWIFIVISSLLFYFCGYHHIPYYLEICFIGILLTIYRHISKRWIVTIPLILISVAICIGINKNENFVSKELYQTLFSNTDQALIDQVLKEDPTLYRMNQLKNVDRTMNKVYGKGYYQTSLYSSSFNKDFHNFVYETSDLALPHRNNLMQVSVDDYLFQTLMGVKYIVSDKEQTLGYHLINQKGETGIYQNLSAFPIGYVSTKGMSTESFEKLSYPYKMEALLNYVVMDQIPDTMYQTNLEPIKLDYQASIPETLNIKKTDNGYQISTSKKETIKLSLSQPIKEKLVLIKFQLSNDATCSNGDLTIGINGIQNKLTCKSWIYYNDNHSFSYVIRQDNLKELELVFSKGMFEIEDIEIYQLDYNKIEDLSDSLYPFILNPIKTKGDQISGTIEVSEDGYFNLSIPYDEGFEILVNGKKVEYQKTNTAFLGFPLSKGTYQIDITYHAPYAKIGYGLSLIGIFLFLVVGRKKITK